MIPKGIPKTPEGLPKIDDPEYISYPVWALGIDKDKLHLYTAAFEGGYYCAALCRHAGDITSGTSDKKCDKCLDIIRRLYRESGHDEEAAA